MVLRFPCSCIRYFLSKKVRKKSQRKIKWYCAWKSSGNHAFHVTEKSFQGNVLIRINAMNHGLLNSLYFWYWNNKKKHNIPRRHVECTIEYHLCCTHNESKKTTKKNYLKWCIIESSFAYIHHRHVGNFFFRSCVFSSCSRLLCVFT